MRISQINNNQNNFKAVNQKYYQWAQKEAKGVQRFGELFFQLKFAVSLKDISPQDGIDTLKAIEKMQRGTFGLDDMLEQMNQVKKYILKLLNL